MEKPIETLCFTGTYEVSVYRGNDAPEKIYNVEETYHELRATLIDRKRCRRLPLEQYEAIINQFAHFAVLSQFGVPTFPINCVEGINESPDKETAHLLTELREKIENIRNRRRSP